MKHIFFITVILSIIACNTKKTIKCELLYGTWECVETDNHMTGLKLDISPEEVWMDPVVNDSIFYYSSYQIKNDSLILSDDYKEYTYCIDELTDNELVLKSGKEKYILKKKHSFFNEKGARESKMRDVTGISKDSLDIIIKSKISLKECGQKCCSINSKEMMAARKIMFAFLNDKGYKKIKRHSTLSLKEPDRYFRQYVGEKNDALKYVYIIFFERYRDFGSKYTELKKNVMWHSGYTIKIDLQKKCVVDFWSNSYDM